MTDQKFNQGIQTAVRVCMNVKERDRVLVISDHKTDHIGSALLKESQSAGANAQQVKLEDIGERPMTKVPAKLLETVEDLMPTVTFYAADSLEGEVGMRMALTQEIRKIYTTHHHPPPRHGHMVGITPRLIREGMAADYQEINRLTLKVHELVRNAKIIKVTSKKGSVVTATFNPDYKWVPCHGLYHQAGDWGNLPEGEVFTCPWDISGKLVVDVLGDFFSTKYGVLEHPVSITVKDSLVQEVSSQNQSLADEFLAYLNSAENGRRAGEFAIGTNISVQELTGNLLQDEKIPGIHVAFGNPIGYQTGADWHSTVHVDVVPTNCTIHVDGRQIMKDGSFLPEVL